MKTIAIIGLGCEVLALIVLFVVNTRLRKRKQYDKATDFNLTFIAINFGVLLVLKVLEIIL